MHEPEEYGTAGRHEKFLRLYLPLRHRLHRFACALTDGPDEALDLTGDTILSALEGYDPDFAEESFRAYLFTIAVRLHRRGRKRRDRMRRLDDVEAENERSSTTSPDVATDIRALREALSQLPARQRETVVLFELSEMTLLEIRDVQGGTLSGVKSRLVRGRERLARLLGAENNMGSDVKRPLRGSPRTGQGAEEHASRPSGTEDMHYPFATTIPTRQ